MAGIRVERQPTATALNRRRQPIGRFDKYIGCVIGTGRPFAAHDAGQADGAVGVGDHAIAFIQRDRITAEQGELFFRLRPAHRKLTLHTVQIEYVIRTVQFQHHVVGNIDQRADRAQAATFQTLHHPGRCLGLGIHALDDAAGETTTKVCSFNTHRQRLLMRWRHRLDIGCVERRIGQGRDFARQTQQSETIRTIRRELEFDADVVETEQFA